MFLHVGPSPALNFRDGEWRGLLSQDTLPASTRAAQTAPHTKVLQHKGSTGMFVHACVRCGELHPSFLTILMSLRSTLVAVLGSMTFMTASTAMGASWEEYWDTTWWEEVT